MPGVKNWMALHMRYRRALPPSAEKYVQLNLHHKQVSAEAWPPEEN